MDSSKANKFVEPESAVIRAQFYKEVLEHPAFNAALAAHRDKIVDAWCNTMPGAEGATERENLWLMYQSALAVKGQLGRAFTKATNVALLEKLEAVRNG